MPWRRGPERAALCRLAGVARKVGDGDVPRLFRRLRVIRQMDSENHLRRAEEHVAEGRHIVQQQKGRIVRLRAAGADTWDAERTLRTLELNLKRFEEHRDSIKRKSRSST